MNTYDDHGAGVVDAAGHEILEIFLAKVRRRKEGRRPVI
jgi:hypothetical protein